MDHLWTPLSGCQMEDFVPREKAPSLVPQREISVLDNTGNGTRVVKMTKTTVGRNPFCSRHWGFWSTKTKTPNLGTGEGGSPQRTMVPMSGTSLGYLGGGGEGGPAEGRLG